MDSFAFGFWAWLGKIAADVAVAALVVFMVIVCLAIWIGLSLMRDALRARRLRKQNICPICEGKGKKVLITNAGMFTSSCSACRSTGKYYPEAING